MTVGHILLEGIVGSTAYGLQTPDSDVDKYGVFAYPTLDIAIGPIYSRDDLKESVVTNHPDATYHEAGKFAAKLMNGNPSMNELLWLPEELYTIKKPLGQKLIDIRWAFLSRQRVMDSYLGYAEQQFRRYVSKGKFNSDISDARAEKHARHLYRLCIQGYHLYVTGTLTVKMTNPDFCRDWAKKAVENPEFAEGFLQLMRADFDNADSCLAEAPHYGRIADWLKEVRIELWNPVDKS